MIWSFSDPKRRSELLSCQNKTSDFSICYTYRIYARRQYFCYTYIDVGCPRIMSLEECISDNGKLGILLCRLLIWISLKFGNLW